MEFMSTTTFRLAPRLRTIDMRSAFGRIVQVRFPTADTEAWIVSSVAP
jgi:hypothetical protein